MRRRNSSGTFAAAGVLSDRPHLSALWTELSAHAKIAKSLRLREGAVGLAAAVGEQAPGGRAIPHQGLATEKQSGYEKDRTLVDTLLGNVALQLRGKPLPAVLTPVLADVIVAVDALTRNPGRMPRFESLSMASRTSDEKGGDLKRYRADKTFEHRRGRSAEHEYNLIDDYLVIISIAGAQVAPKQMKVDKCDEQSGVRLLEDTREDDEDSVLIAQYPALRSISAQIRRVGQKAKLDGHGARLFVDAILADATNCLVQGCTVTASLENALRGHYEMQASNGRRSSSHKRSRRSRSRSSASGSESDGEATSSGSEASSRKVVPQASISSPQLTPLPYLRPSVDDPLLLLRRRRTPPRRSLRRSQLQRRRRKPGGQRGYAISGPDAR